MDKPDSSCAILSKLNLDDVEKVVKEAYHKEDGPVVEKQVYAQRGPVERVNSRLKDQLCLERHRARGWKKPDPSHARKIKRN